MRKSLLLLLTTALALVGLLAPVATPAQADTPGGQLVSDVAAAGTPHVLDGQVNAIAKVGGTVILAGTFTRARNDSGDTTSLVRNGLLAFDAATGKISTTFVPNPNSGVTSVVSAGDGSTVYVAGTFTSIGGTTRQRIARVRVSDGAVVTAFDAGSVTGAVKDLNLTGGRLWAAGAFTHIKGRGQTALATLDPTTGSPTPYMSLPIAGIHNSGVTQVLDIDITPDGSRLVAIGNFDTLAGVKSHQLLSLDLTGATAAAGPFTTDFYLKPCLTTFDTYMRDVDFSPDGTYFVVGTSGGYGGADGGCDTIARFETASVGAVRPSWIEVTGGDTTWGVEVTDSVVYVGGHFRWMNNPMASGRAGQGAVSREGLTALDPASGLPFSWNPGRDKGIGVFDFLLADEGLYIASDTDRIGDYQYKGRIARMPRAGLSFPAVRTPVLPNDVYSAGPVGAAATATTNRVLYRVNARGLQMPAQDVAVAAARQEVLDTDLRTSSSLTERQWDFQVPQGTPVDVRLRYTEPATSDRATAAVVVEGRRAAPRVRTAVAGAATSSAPTIVGAVSTAAAPRATVRTVPLTSDGNVDVTVANALRGQKVRDLSVVRTAAAPAAAAPVGSLSRRSFADGAVGASTLAPDGGQNWDDVRGAFMVNGDLYVAKSDGTFDKRSFDGTTYGPVSAVNTADQLVVLTDWQSDIRAATGMFFANGRIYFTRADTNTLYYRYFNPQSGIVGARRLIAASNVAGFDARTVRGMFATASALYWATSDGALRKASWAQNAQSGVPVANTAQVVSGPAVDGATWGARAMFVYQGPAGSQAVAPTASFTESCTTLTCSFDARASTSPGATVTAYDWSFGDGQTATGATPTHTYAGPGTRTVTLQVTSSNGRTGTTSHPVAVADAPVSAVSFVGANRSTSNATAHRVAVPAGVQAGDTLLLYLTLNDSTVTPAAPAGWTALDNVSASGVIGRSWSRTATAADAGSTITITTSGLAKSDLGVQVYRGSGGASQVTAHAAAVDSVSGTTHRAPTVTAGAGDWVVTQWIAKSSVDTSWATPAGTVRRSGTTGTGGGRLTSLGVDGGTGVAAGTAGGTTASSSVAVSRTVMFTTAIGTS
ncbi:PKD domain-containing protein [Nocardioides psychrotolerans]|uniref:PKD domain-containing protein n=1 Tax=Nocardioides psychrotolerans TaxID=1005945 RepID=UPI003137A8C0